MEDHYIRDNGESHHIGDHHSNPQKDPNRLSLGEICKLLSFGVAVP